MYVCIHLCIYVQVYICFFDIYIYACIYASHESSLFPLNAIAMSSFNPLLCREGLATLPERPSHGASWGTLHRRCDILPVIMSLDASLPPLLFPLP